MKQQKFSNLTTFKTGGDISYYFEVNTEKELISSVKFAKSKSLQIFVIGEGSDILVSDKTFEGVVIKYVGRSIEFINDKNNPLVIAEAGLIWDELVEYAVNLKLQGIECLSGIPGTVGAAPVQNIGAYGQELCDTLEYVRVYSVEKEEFLEISNKDCCFGYRDSFFKKTQNWQKYIVTKVGLRLHKNKKPQVLYDSIKPYISKNPTLHEVRDAVIKVRHKKLVDYKEIPNAGSFFKNPIVSKKIAEEIKDEFPEMKAYPVGNKFKIFAGFLIEKAGWKGKRLGPVKVSDKHALILTNPEGKGKTKDIVKLARAVQDGVYKKFGIKLEPEVQYINF